MLLFSLLDTRSPIEKFLMGCVKVQNDREIVLSVVQMCILHDLLQAEKLYEQGKIKTKEVPLKTIQKRYDLKRYIVSRNAVSLSKRKVKDKDLISGVREGKGWVTNAALKDSSIGDDRMKAIILTNKGRDLAQILFNIRK
jgi:hypothetical protein